MTAEAERYDLLLSPGARRALTELLPPAAAFAAREFVNGPLRAAPHTVGVPLREPFTGLWRGRQVYRVRFCVRRVWLSRTDRHRFDPPLGTGV